MSDHTENQTSDELPRDERGHVDGQLIQPTTADYVPFRPLRARRVAVVAAISCAVMCLILVILLPGLALLDIVGFLMLAAGVAWFMFRQASVRAVPSEQGLVVRNLIHTRTVTWAEIVSVRFGRDRAWVQLDLADTDTLAVMAIQRADGPLAEAAARRLATLVEWHHINR